MEFLVQLADMSRTVPHLRAADCFHPRLPLKAHKSNDSFPHRIGTRVKAADCILPESASPDLNLHSTFSEYLKTSLRVRNADCTSSETGSVSWSERAQ